MANFVAYTKRLDNRKYPTIHVVSAFGGGGREVLIPGNAPDWGQDINYGTDESINGLYGSPGPDWISSGVSATGALALGVNQVVGVQMVSLSFTKDGTITANVRGEGLCQYVERTEHRYLENGHSSIMVYFLESSVNQLRVQGGGMILQFNVLLQTANSIVVGDMDMRNMKKSVPVTLLVPYDDGSNDSFQNPSIDLNAWLYGNGGVNFGTTVTVQDMGTDDSGKYIWNTVRTQNSDFLGHHPTYANINDQGHMGSAYQATNDTRFWNYIPIGQHQQTGAGNIESSFLALDVSRNFPDVYLYGSRENNGWPLIEDTGNSRAYHLQYPYATSSGRVFDMLELFGWANSDILEEPTGADKLQWGKHVGLRARHPWKNDPRSTYGTESPGGWPQIRGGNSLISAANIVEHPGPGYPHGELDGVFWGGKSRFNLNGKSNNPYNPNPGPVVTANGPFRSDSVAFSNYVTFYCIEGASWTNAQYMPSDLSQTPVGLGNNIAFGGFMSDVFRQTIMDELGSTNQNLVQNNSTSGSQVQIFQDLFVDQTQDYFGWHDYVAHLFKCTMNPTLTTYNESMFENLVESIDVAYSTSALHDIFDVKFSGAISPVPKMNEIFAEATSTGFKLLTTPAYTTDFYGVPLFGGAGVDIDPRGKDVFMYTVFVYSDGMQSKVGYNDYQSPLYETPPQNESINNGTLLQEFQSNTSPWTTYSWNLHDSEGNIADNVKIKAVDWGDITPACIDRNSSVFSATIEDNANDEEDYYANDNSCNDTSYNRCGCKQIVEEFALTPLENFTPTDPAGRRRFESVITYPRPVTTHQNSTLSPTSTYTSILYTAGYFSVESTTSGTVDSLYRSDYLDISSTSAVGEVTFDTSSGDPFTHLLGSGDFDEYTDYPNLIWFSDLADKSIADNTFTFAYFPGREHYESTDGSAYFFHDDASECKTYLTLGGGGSGSATDDDDVENRHYLLFEADKASSMGTSAKRAHSDLQYGENWETSNTEASFISIGVNSDCATADDDNPRRRVRWFVNVGRKVSEGLDDGGDEGDGGGEAVFGCTDPTAFNYNADATDDDGSCTFCDTEFSEDVEAVIGNIDPVFLLPHLYGERETCHIEGTTGKTEGISSVDAGGCTGDLVNCSPEVLFVDNEDGPGSFDWWDGNVYNAFNVRGPNADFTVGALNGAASPYTDAPHNNEADSALTFFRHYVDTTVTMATAAQSAIIDQFGASDAALESALITYWNQLKTDNAANVTLHIFRYADWDSGDAKAVRRNMGEGNNGWALDSYSGSLSAGQYKANVYSDYSGDFTGIGLQNADELAILTNKNSGSWNHIFDFTSVTPGTTNTVDLGLEAGHHYIAVVRFQPRKSCPGTDANPAIYYYWAYNFFVEYCACTQGSSENAGYGNPDASALTESQLPYWTGAPWSGVSYFPATNSPYANITTGTFTGTSGAIPSAFCGLGVAQARLFDPGTADGGNLGNAALCAVRDPDATVICDDFYSWCLSDISEKCNTDAEGNPYGSLDFSVLIDGFFTQSDSDPWNLVPVYDTGVTPPNVYFYFKIEVYLAGVLTYEIFNYVPDGNGGFVLNEAEGFTLTSAAAAGETTYLGQLASINFTGIEWSDDLDADGQIDDLQLSVNLVYLGTVNVLTGAIDSAFPDYIVDDAGNPVTSCDASTIEYTATVGDCAVRIEGCTDPLALNFNPDATVNDGSCEYRDCDELFDSFKTSIFVTSVTTSDDTLECETVTEGEVEINYYLPQYTGTMEIIVQDFASGVLGVGNQALTQGQFTICVLRLQAGAVTLLPAALQYYQDFAGTIQNLPAGQALSIGSNDDGLNGCFIAPDNPVTEGIDSGTLTDPPNLSGTQYTTNVPADAIFTQGGGGLTSGTYLVFIIPFLDLTDLEDTDGYTLSDCDSVFLSYIDEVTTAAVGTVLGDDTCPEPCNQFSDPELCPDAVPGCTDQTAQNYNPDATFNDGTCEYCEDCDPCDFYPLDPECEQCDRGEGATIGSRVAGFGARFRECDGETEECCTDPTACNYKEDCEVGKKELCEYDCTEGGDDCEGVADADCDDTEPTCPDPSNPECEGDPVGNCLESGDCPCVGVQCNEDCIFEDANCDPPPIDDDDPITDIFTTVTAICLPDSGPGSSGSMNVYFADGSQADSIGEAAAMCSVYNGDKMLMKMRTGVKYDDTDLLKLSLINYLLTRSVTTQLDCMLDCNNYPSGAKSGGRILGHTDRFKGAVSCENKWKAQNRQYFAGSSTFKRGTVVRYLRAVNGRMVGSYFIAKNDWQPGMDTPDGTNDTEKSSWTPCINFKYQEGTNPENYYMTFYEFINRHCQSCTVAIAPEERAQQYNDTLDSKNLPNFKPNRSFGAGFIDEDGNEIIF